MLYPHLLDSIRELFLSALTKRGIVTEKKIEREAIEKIRAEGQEPNEENIREYIGLLIDLYFANFFSDAEIENHINLARKQDRFKNLNRVINKEGATSKNIKQALKEFCEIPMGDLYISPNEAEGVRVALINHFISNQLPFIGIGKQHITIRDIEELVDNIYWSHRRPGKIGGKAAGMLLAYKILQRALADGEIELSLPITIPESYYLGSDLFYEFHEQNDLHDFHNQKYKTHEEIIEEYPHIIEVFIRGRFSDQVIAQLRELLIEVGQTPLIVRSSSLLEDNFGSSFAGKYDSYFCPNQGTPEENLAALTNAIARTYASTLKPEALRYRRSKGLQILLQAALIGAEKAVILASERTAEIIFEQAG